MNKEITAKLHTLFHELSGKEISVEIANKLNQFVESLPQTTRNGCDSISKEKLREAFDKLVSYRKNCEIGGDGMCHSLHQTSNPHPIEEGKIDKITFQRVVSNTIKAMYQNEMSPREQKIIEFRYGKHDGVTHTFEETGKEFDVTRERIRQIEGKFYEKIRVNLGWENVL